MRLRRRRGQPSRVKSYRRRRAIDGPLITACLAVGEEWAADHPTPEELLRDRLRRAGLTVRPPKPHAA